jgi:hypothetical protein
MLLKKDIVQPNIFNTMAQSFFFVQLRYTRLILAKSANRTVIFSIISKIFIHHTYSQTLKIPDKKVNYKSILLKGYILIATFFALAALLWHIFFRSPSGLVAISIIFVLTWSIFTLILLIKIYDSKNKKL